MKKPQSLSPSLPSSTLGCFECISIPELGIEDQLAKVDTGAYSGAIGCSRIETVKKEGKKFLRFSPGRMSKKIYETGAYYEKYVKSSSGHRAKRYLIDTEISIRGTNYPMTISLADRSEMKHMILLGRKFLREHNLLVDVSLNQEYDTDMELK